MVIHAYGLDCYKGLTGATRPCRLARAIKFVVEIKPSLAAEPALPLQSLHVTEYAALRSYSMVGLAQSFSCNESQSLPGYGELVKEASLLAGCSNRLTSRSSLTKQRKALKRTLSQ